MSTTFFPTQIGFTPTGSDYGSQIVLGKNIASPWEAIGFGAAGRPDPLERVYFNISQISGLSTPSQLATLAFQANDIKTIIAGSTNAAAAALTFQFREMDVCDGGVAKKVMVMATAPYVR